MTTDLTAPLPTARVVVDDPLRFKAALGIGENAYALLRLRNAAWAAWDAAGVAATGAAVAASPPVAATFFGASGFWAAIGLGGTAVTPVGWVVLAGVVSGGTWLGLTRALKGAGKAQVTVVPHVINTPMDVLALGLFDLMAPLALKVAAIDGPVTPAERAAIAGHFRRTWGFDAGFVDEGLAFLETQLDGIRLQDVAATLADFKRDNPDCDYAAMSAEILAFLHAVAAADGPLDEREELALDKVRALFARADRFSPLRSLRRFARGVTAALRRGDGRRDR